MFNKFLNIFFGKNETKNIVENKTLLEFYRIESPFIKFIEAELIEGIYVRDNEYFWEHHGYHKRDYIKLAEKSKILYENFLAGVAIDELKFVPECEDIVGAYLGDKCIIKVYQKEEKYILVGDGRHRVAAAQELRLFIPVKVVGEYRPVMK